MIKNFNQFLNENTINNLKSIKSIENKFDYFHISTNKLGNEFIFNARIPNMPFKDKNGDIIEDDFTKRVSLSTTIKKCLDAITDEEVDGYYVYAVKTSNLDQNHLIDLHTIKCPIGYNAEFTLKNFLISNGIKNEYNSPALLPEEIKKIFYGCVPDCAVTEEYWYIKDIKMTYIGEVIPWKYGIKKILIK